MVRQRSGDDIHRAAAAHTASTRPPAAPEAHPLACSEATLWAGPGEKRRYRVELPKSGRGSTLVCPAEAAALGTTRLRQEAGAFMVGVGRVYEKSRAGSFCLSAGPLAESAFKSMLGELMQRALRQYDTPSGPVAF